MKWTISLILMLGLFTGAQGQQMRYLNINEGLSSRYTYGIEQDKEGFMWFATNEGIDRYDGNEFRSYKLISSVINPTELGYRFNILTDSSRVIWAYTTSGKVFRYDKFKDDFILIFEVHAMLKNRNTSTYVNSVFFDRSNKLWIGAVNGTYCAKIVNSTLEWLHPCSELGSYSFEESDQGQIWAGTNDGVKILTPEENLTAKSVQQEKLSEDTKGMQIRALFYDSINKKLWLGSDKDGPSVYDFSKNMLVDLNKLTPHVPIRSIVKDKQNHILIGLDGAGINRLDANSFAVTNVWLKTEDQADGISDNSVLDLYCDDEGRIWVSTWSAGITIIDFQKPKLRFIEHQFNNENSIRSSQVNSIFEDSDGDLWFGTNSGVSILNQKTNTWSHLSNLKNSSEISDYKILTLGEDDQKRIWIGGYANGLHCYDKKSRILTDFTAEVGINYPYISYYDQTGNMWFGGMEGLITKMDLKSSRFSKYNIKNVTVAINKNQSQIWVGTTSGLYLADKQSDKVTRYAEFAPRLEEISNKYINCLYQDKTGRLWIGTNGGGLNLLDPVKGQIRVISTDDGLPSNFIYGILADKNDRIWLSTEKGIGCFDPGANSIVNIGYIDKFTNFLFNKNAYAKTKSGDIVLGGLNGAIIFNPERIQPYSSKSKLILNEFRISYQRVYPDDRNSPLKVPIDQASEIRLKYIQNSFSFRFSSINFDNTSQVVYQWKLQGFDSDWTPLTSNQTAGYTNIPPGDYTFKIRCITRTNLAIDNERQIAIHIRPPFWKTDLAFIGYIILFTGLFWLIYTLDQNRLNKKHADDKINFFISTAHDIKTPVSLIKAPLKDLEADKGITSQGLYYLKLAQSNADKLAQVVNQILDFEKVDSKKSQIVLLYHNLTAYLNEKILSYQLLADENEILLSYNLPDYEYNAMFDEAKMDKILDNLFSNAIKYTPPKGSIELTVRANEKEWILELTDTGIGIPKKDRKNLFKMYYRAENAINSRESGTGIGLMLIQNLVKLHGGKVSFTSQENIGSTFILSFPRKSDSEENVEKLRLSFTQQDQELQNLPGVGQQVISNIPEISKNQIKVLIVEDDYDLRNYLASTLSKQFHVFTAEDGLIAIDLVLKEKFDLIISDVMLPKLRGDELCRRIKTTIETSHIPVILLTALSDKQNTIIGLEAGADHYITKPFDMDIVNARINNILKNRKLIRQSLLKGINPPVDKVAINNLDKLFIDEILHIVERELANPEFSITNLCRETAMSRTLLYNKIKVHTGLAPNEYIRIIRMNKAMDLLKSGQYSIGEIAYHVGFQDSKYFSTAFKKFFGKSPKHFHHSTDDAEEAELG